MSNAGVFNSCIFLIKTAKWLKFNSGQCYNADIMKMIFIYFSEYVINLGNGVLRRFYYE